jgi:L,D-transpeptidase YcbB
MGPRYVLVDAAAAQLWYVEGGEIVDTMPVGIGRVDEPTPVMAGVIRYAMFNPHWNLPEAMIRDEIAPAVLSQGPSYLEGRQMEALSDWSKQARVLDPGEVDWAAVAAGKAYVRVRQRPGGQNLMGQVKLMLPNELGIYLHDTPDKTVFSRTRRTVSAGCVRLADAMRLTEALLGPERARPTPGVFDQRVNLAKPTPVYITYFTLAPENGRLTRRPDPYKRDRALIAALSDGQGPPRERLT